MIRQAKQSHLAYLMKPVISVHLAEQGDYVVDVMKVKISAWQLDLLNVLNVRMTITWHC